MNRWFRFPRVGAWAVGGVALGVVANYLFEVEGILLPIIGGAVGLVKGVADEQGRNL